MKYDLSISSVKLFNIIFFHLVSFICLSTKKCFLLAFIIKVHPFCLHLHFHPYIVHPWTCDKEHSSMSKNVLKKFYWCGQNIFKNIWSCSFASTHLLMSIRSWNNIPLDFATNCRIYYKEKNDASSQGFKLCELNEFGLLMIKF
jgi:hypothetical protein